MKKINKSKKITKNEPIEYRFSYKKILLFIIFVFIIGYIISYFFNNKIYQIEKTNLCEIKETLTAKMTEVKPIRSDFLYVGGEQEHQIKNYLCGEIDLIKGEGLRIWGNVFTSELKQEDIEQSIQNELSEIKDSDSDVVILVCSKGEYEFCFSEAKKMKKYLDVIIVKSPENIEGVKFDGNGEIKECIIE